MMMVWTLLGAFGMLFLLALVGILLVELTRWPPEIPKRDRPLLRKAYKICRSEVGPAAWGPLPPGTHRYDAHLYTAFFVMLRDVYLSDGAALSRAEREIVATAVSVSNRCYLCIHNHSRLVQISSPRGIDQLILSRQIDEIEDPRLQDLARYGLMTKQPMDDIIRDPPFTAEETSDAAIVAFNFHYVNRVMDALGPREGLRRELLSKPPPRLLGRILSLSNPVAPGTGLARVLALNLTYPVEIDEHDRSTILKITHSRRDVADAMMFSWSTARRVARELFGDRVLQTIRAHLASWDGIATPLDFDWLDEATEALRDDPRAHLLARQGILVARDAFQTSRRELWEASGRDRRRQLALVCFAAYAAALRISEWVVVPARSEG